MTSQSDVEAAREAYDAFLSHYPYCYGYWRKYADYEKRKGSKKKCLEVSPEFRWLYIIFNSLGELAKLLNTCIMTFISMCINTWIPNCFSHNWYFAIIFFPNSATRPAMLRQSQQLPPENSITSITIIDLAIVVHCLWCIFYILVHIFMMILCTRMMYCNIFLMYII